MPSTQLILPRLPGLAWVVLCSLWLSITCTAAAAATELQAELTHTQGTISITYHSGTNRLTLPSPEAPAGVQLRFPGSEFSPVPFRAYRKEGSLTELEPTNIGNLRLRLQLRQVAPGVIERSLEVTARAAQTFTLAFPITLESSGEFASFTGPVTQRTVFDTVRGAPKIETFPVGMLRASNRVMGLAADSPGLWENRCQVVVDPSRRQVSVLTGDGRDPYALVIKPPEDARDTYQYQMDGWQRLGAGETRRFVTWVFVSPAQNHYDAQVAAHLAVANGKGWNHSLVEAILRNTSLYLLRRNLALDANSQPRDGRYIFISGPGYGWKQWVSDGFYTALGLDDPEKTIESNRAVFWTRMDYEDNSHYYLIWAVLMKRAGGSVNDALVRKAYSFLRSNETNGLFVPPSLPGAPNSKGWKTYHDVLPYDEDDSPASNQGFHCGALMAAQELGLGTSDADITRAIEAYRALFNRERGFMPTSRKLRDTLGQDTLYGATLTYAVFGRKLLTDDQVIHHIRTSEKVRTPYGLRVISQADGSLLPGHSGVYCYGGSWFLNDAANYLLGAVHGMPGVEIDQLLTERIAREIAHTPAFNESISTVDGHPHGHILYSWNSGYWWLRKEIRKRLGESSPDPVDAAIDRRFGVVREGGFLQLDPDRRGASAGDGARATIPPVGASPVNSAVGIAAPESLRVGYTELRSNLPGGRHANVRTCRAMMVNRDGTNVREIGSELVDSPDAWTQFAGWSPNGQSAILVRGWQQPENALWEEEHKTFRMEPGRWELDSCLVETISGKLTRPTALQRVSHYNGGLFFLPDGKTLGFTALIKGVSKPFTMALDGTNKRDVSGEGGGFAYGYSASPDGKLISYHEDYQIHIANVDGTGKKRIDTGNPFNFGPSWSADGSWLLFVSGVRGNSHPYVVRRDGTGLRKLADLNGYQGWILFLDVPDFHEGSSDVPTWAADGQSVFYSAKVNGAVELFQAPLEGSPRQLTHVGGDALHYHAQPSKDGRWLVYGSKRDGIRQLYVRNLITGAEHAVTAKKPGYAAMWAHWQPGK